MKHKVQIAVGAGSLLLIIFVPLNGPCPYLTWLGVAGVLSLMLGFWWKWAKQPPYTFWHTIDKLIALFALVSVWAASVSMGFYLLADRIYAVPQ